MRLRYNLGKILFLVCHTLTLAEIEHRDPLVAEGDPGPAPLKRTISDYPGCQDNFEIHHDKIIRTQDSKALGARYLNERDVSSRDECMQLCCSSDNCDVFVFEENKVPGGCYLFECGPADDFKCKFTKYKNYTSGFLNVNRHLSELEQIKYSQHERELTKLREHHSKALSGSETQAAYRTTVSPKTKEVLEQYGSDSVPQPITGKRGCNRNQFECHSSGECIAIYNACDGIPQCSDGSDESPELGCPAIQTTMSTQIRHVRPSAASIVRQQEFMPEMAGSGDSSNTEREINVAPVRKQWPSREDYGLKSQQTVYQQKIPPSGSQTSSLSLQDFPRASYGREGEEMANYRGPDQWSSSQYRHSQGSQIFTHKGEGLVPQNNRFQQQPHSYIPPETQMRSGIQYSDPGQSDYAKYYNVDNSQYNRMYNGQGSLPNWQIAPKPHNLNIPDPSGQNMDEIPISRGDIPQAGPYPDYYYEEMYKNKLQQQQQPQPLYPVIPPASYQAQSEPVVPIQPIQPKVSGHIEEAKPVDQVSKPVVETTTIGPAETKSPEKKVKEGTSSHEHQAKSSHRKVDKLTADVRIKESNFDEEAPRSHSPRGAILSLTMGMCITGIMLILVGCRMRMVHKRMRRNGKGYAHDADFLVNGMYL